MAPHSPTALLTPQEHSSGAAHSSMWSASGPDGDRNEQPCQIICHELPLRDLALPDIQALGWYKRHKDAGFINMWASFKKKKCLSFFKQFTTTFSLRGPGSPEDETERPDGCWIFTAHWAHAHTPYSIIITTPLLMLTKGEGYS